MSIAPIAIRISVIFATSVRGVAGLCCCPIATWRRPVLLRQKIQRAVQFEITAPTREPVEARIRHVG
jgi:hypothetical protein